MTEPQITPYGVSTTGTEATTTQVTLITCDQCPTAFASGWVLTSAGPLAFCQHHLNKYAATFAAKGWAVSDDLASLELAEQAQTLVDIT